MPCTAPDPFGPRRERRLLLGALAALLGGCASSWPSAQNANGFAAALGRALPFTVGVYGMARPQRPDYENGAGPSADAERGNDDSLPFARVGAGFLIDAEGHVVTAAHVVADCEQVLVKLSDRRVLVAESVGADPDTDIALLRIAYTPPAPPPLGRSATLRPGHWVLGIGEPYGLNRSVTAGIVGGKDRHFVDDPEMLFIQTDLALNPGNSGGPLLDAGGTIVGMNMRTVVGALGAPGVSLSVPIEVVLAVVGELRRLGSIARPRLGAEFDDLLPALALQRGRSDTQGVLITAVRPGSLADRLGLRVDDIVLAMNGKALASSADLARVLLDWREPAGTRMTVLRGSVMRELLLRD